MVAALNAVQPYDWATFLHERLNGHGPGAPLGGLTRGGYRLVYTDVESPYLKSAESERKFADFSFSIGLTLSTRDNGMVTQVIWDGPAFKAGLTADAKILAVNGDAFTVDGLKSAIKAATSGAPIELVVQDKDEVRTLKLDYHGGLRYPHLEKTAAHASLDDILTPRS